MLLRILILLIALTLLPAWYISRRFLQKENRRKWRWLLWTPNLFLLAITFWLTFTEDFTPSYVTAKAWLLTALLCITVPEMLFTLISVVGRLLYRWPRVEKVWNVIALAVGLGSLYVMLVGFFFGCRQLTVKEHVFASKDIPAAFDGYRIVQLTDLHIGTYGTDTSFVARIKDSIQAHRPDLLVFTGDLVNYQSAETRPFLTQLQQLKAPDGTYSIMGNHDYMSYLHWPSVTARQRDVHRLITTERALGWTLLLNQSVILRHGNDSIGLVGVENDGRPPFPQFGNLPKALKGLPQGTKEKPFFKILLSHDPTHWRRRVLSDTDISLMLAGHTHGMQFRIFGWSPGVWFYREFDGMYHQGNRGLFVSIGVGEVLLPFRYGAWPTIDVITLKSEQVNK